MTRDNSVVKEASAKGATAKGAAAKAAASKAAVAKNVAAAQSAGAQGAATKSASAKSSAFQSATAADTAVMPHVDIEDTGNIIPKGAINAPKIAKATVSEEERRARAEARKEAQRMEQLKNRPTHTALGRWWRKLQMSPDRIRFGMCIVAMGVVYGDIGTSPLYTIQTFVAGQGGIQHTSRFAVVGMLSLLFWSITLITTVKYVLIAMRIDNKGEGGIFALYALVRKYGKWLAIPAMVGGAAFLADSVLTPAMSISSAVEGLSSIPQLQDTFSENTGVPLIVTAIIIIVLFSIQFRGTEKIGRLFGSIIAAWFTFIALIGVYNLRGDWSVFEALNPMLGIEYLFSGENKVGIALMGTVFLSITGAEALYSDMGHVGRGSIYATWPIINVALVLCYFGQGSWILRNRTNPTIQAIPNVNPFFQMMPTDLMRTIAVVLAVIAGIIASQALITGAYTMVSEATSLNWAPHLQVRYPSRTRGQLYIPVVNVALCAATLTVLLLFRTSEHIAAAYGLALTITMITTAILLGDYIWNGAKKKVAAVVFDVVFLTIQAMFLIASLAKFLKGGWFTMLLTLLILLVMASWDLGTKIERSQRRHLNPKEFLPALNALHSDSSVPYYADNVVYLTSDSEMRRLDTDIFYSIFGDQLKRARAWWSVSVQVTDDPYTREYSVENFGTNYLYRVRIRLGFKVSQNIATYLHQIMHELIASGELPAQPTIYPKLDNDQEIGTIQYVFIHKELLQEAKISATGIAALRMKYAIRHAVGSPAKWFGLAAYNPRIEYQPVFTQTVSVAPLKRIALRRTKHAATLQSVMLQQSVAAQQKVIRDAEEETAEQPVASKLAAAQKSESSRTDAAAKSGAASGVAVARVATSAGTKRSAKNSAKTSAKPVANTTKGAAKSAAKASAKPAAKASAKASSAKK